MRKAPKRTLKVLSENLQRKCYVGAVRDITSAGVICLDSIFGRGAVENIYNSIIPTLIQ